jgi:hypothetical protein
MNDSVRAFVDWSGEFEELYKFNGQWPKPKEWVGLTNEEIKSVASLGIYEKPLIEFTRAIETKLKEKNT